MSELVSIISLGISFVALAVAVWSHARQHKLGKRMLALEEARERDRRLAKRKAELVATLDRNRLYIENKGQSEAREIAVLLDGQPVLQHPAVIQRQEEVRQVAPGSHFAYMLGVSFDTPPPGRIEISWSDDYGEPGMYRTTLTF